MLVFVYLILISGCGIFIHLSMIFGRDKTKYKCQQCGFEFGKAKNLSIYGGYTIEDFCSESCEKLNYKEFLAENKKLKKPIMHMMGATYFR